MQNNYHEFSGKGVLVVEGWDLPAHRHWVTGIFNDWEDALFYIEDNYTVHDIFACNVAIVQQDNEGNRKKVAT